MLVESFAAIVAWLRRRSGQAPNDPPAANDNPPLERKNEMTADNFRSATTWVAAMFVSLLLVAATTSLPVMA